jgi:acetyl esterase
MTEMRERENKHREREDFLQDWKEAGQTSRSHVSCQVPLGLTRPSRHVLTRNGRYTAREEKVAMRDGMQIGVKIYHPKNAASDKKKLPLLFVTHGGGWVQGTYVTEEAWLLYPLFVNFGFVVVNVDYRLAPEETYPTYVDDCWDALQWTVGKVEELGADPEKLFLAGSSAGGCLAAVMAQKARDAKMVVKGVVLNVPVMCHPRWFPREEYEYTSYVQCAGTMLNGEDMYQVWDIACPDSERGKEVEASPLLGEVKGLPPHLVFVAGQDPLRDEAVAYVEKMENAGVKVKWHIYQGVPHTFAEIWELDTTTQFQQDLVAGIREMLR